MKEIPLTQGKVAIVDDEDYDFLSQFKWCALQSRSTFYAHRGIGENGKVRIIHMHRLLLDAPKGMEVDHIDHDGLNNTRQNIRLCTRVQQHQNRQKCQGGNPKYGTTSKYKGVSWYKNLKKWVVHIRVNRRLLHLGYFSNEDEAALAYNQAAIKYFREFACCNVLKRG